MSNGTPKEQWLSEYKKESTAYINKGIFEQYLAFLGKSDIDLVTEHKQTKDRETWNKQTRNRLLQFQAWLLKPIHTIKGKPNQAYEQNTARTRVQIIRAFYNSQCEQIRGLKGKIVKQTIAKGEHIFSLEDLKAIREIGDYRDKAMISSATSLGWETSAFLDLERDFVKRLVERAKSQKSDFIMFETTRAKSGEIRLGILNPIALYDLEKYLEATESEATERLFPITPQALIKWLGSMTEKANIKTIGTIKFHLIRKFLMSALSSAGLNEFQIDLILGKAIEPSKLTYLQTLKNEAFEKYKKAYPMHLSLSTNVNGNAKFNQTLDLAIKMVESFENLRKHLKGQGLLKKLPTEFEEQFNTLFEYSQIMKKKNGESKEETKEHA